MNRLAAFGGVYSNHLALDAVVADARAAGADAIHCLGDLGAFGPHPDRTCETIREEGIPVVAGNYDRSIGLGLDDCQCGYTDPRDNLFASISYRYTFANTSPRHRDWMRTLPATRRLDVGGKAALLAHGSPRRINEFLWETTTSDAFLVWLLDTAAVDLLLVTHTGLPWSRRLADGRTVVNVGAIGRPANDGDPRVVYPIVAVEDERIEVEWRRVAYDHQALAEQMRAESLPEEFVETIETGWWTTCLEVLPAKERARGRH
ncbi:MAG: metallophosphoesterase family protein [Gemmatimonadota bacterium]|nr:metallophosphoesterase family protein [Gemmatimonadota bacterium]